MSSPDPSQLLTTPLDSLHRSLGARMVPFAGYSMPVQYPSGIIKEHEHCRAAAALFDVSHMGQARITGAARASALESLVPGAITTLKPGQQRYTLLTNETGGTLDDLMVTNRGDDLFLVVNAACKEADFAHIAAGLAGHDARLEILADRALLALQGPAAVSTFAQVTPDLVESLRFMQGAAVTVDGMDLFVTRSGYTGEDGLEISVPAALAADLAERLLALEGVAPAGLGARDSLRLEAGLCLYGSDITTETSPIEAGLAWAIGKRRRIEGGFPGAAVIQEHLQAGTARKRVGLTVAGRRPVRAHAPILDPASGGVVGEVTSGGFAPSLKAPIAMGYVDSGFAAEGTELHVDLRGTAVSVATRAMPFVPHRYCR